MVKQKTSTPRNAWSGYFTPRKHQRVNTPGLGPGRITDFFFEPDHEGTLWQGVVVHLENPPEWHKRQNPDDPFAYLFGIEVSLIDEGGSA